MAGVSAMYITKLCRDRLASACTGKKVDLDATSVGEWLRSKGVDPTAAPEASVQKRKKSTAARPRPAGFKTSKTKRAKVSKPKRSAPPRPAAKPKGGAAINPKTVEPIDGVEWEEVEALAHCSLNALVARFGTAEVFKSWLDARKKISDIHEKDLKNAQTEGSLIRRDVVKSHVMGAIEAGNRRMLGDFPKKAVRTLYANAASGVSAEESEQKLRALITKQLDPIKNEAARGLRAAKSSNG